VLRAFVLKSSVIRFVQPGNDLDQNRKIIASPFRKGHRTGQVARGRAATASGAFQPLLHRVEIT